MREKSAFLAFLTSLALFLLLSCSGSGRDKEAMAMIESMAGEGNTHPREALLRMDSLKSLSAGCSEHVRMRCALLEIRLHDKAFDVAADDSCIKVLVDYFEEHGTPAERQEAYYYAGSIYRDMEDAPRSLRYFLKSAEVAADSALLINAYAQLHLLYYKVQNYPLALEMAQRERKVAEQTNDMNAMTLMDVATAEQFLLNPEERLQSLNTTLAYIKREHTAYQDKETLYWLMYYYAVAGSMEDARECKVMIDSVANEGNALVKHQLLGYYYLAEKDTAMAVACFLQVAADTLAHSNLYDTSKDLLRIYASQGNLRKAVDCALQFADISDSINLGQKRQDILWAQKEHQLQKEQQQEAEMAQQQQHFRHVLSAMAAGILIVLLSAGLAFSVYRQRQLRLLLRHDEEFRSLQEYARRQKEEMELQLKHADDELDKSRQLLVKRLKQVRHYSKLLHLANIETCDADTVASIRKAVKGEGRMKAKEWQKFYGTVERLFPDLADDVALHLGMLSEDQKQVCYLARMGFANSEIHKITDIPTTSVWRWAKRYREALGISITHESDGEDAEDMFPES